MTPEQKRELLDRQIAEAKDGNPADLNLWKETTKVVLRNTVGDAHQLYSSFSAIKYTLSAWSDATPKIAWDAARERGVRSGIAILEAAKLEVELSGGVTSPEVESEALAAAGQHVFVVHGHDAATLHEVARFLAKATGNEPHILGEEVSGGRTVIEKFEAIGGGAGYAVVLATADDLGRARTEAVDQPRARQNVVFELGFFYGLLGRARVGFMYEPGIEIPSDTAGIVRIKLDEGGGWKLQLAREMADAGIGINWEALR